MQQILLIVQILIAVGLVAMVLLQQGARRGRRGVVRRRLVGLVVRLAGARVLSVQADRGSGRPVSFANSLALAYISSHSVERRSVVERVQSMSEDSGLRSGDGDVPALPGGSGDSAVQDVPQAPVPE